MAKKGHKGVKGRKRVTPKQGVERKANASLTQAENQVLQGLQGLQKEHPEWVDKHGNCPQCVLEEYNLVEPHYYPEEE